jgi:hypothetical protein
VSTICWVSVCTGRAFREGIINVNEREEELHQTAERFATQMGAQFDVHLDFTPASLQRLDGMLEQMIDLSEAYWSDRQEDLLPVALAITAYVGEVIRRSFDGATWITEFEEGEIPPPHLKLQQGIRLNLMKKSIQILTRNDTPSFTGYYQTAEQIARNQDSGSDANG